jgi:hypothetical protein
MLAKTRPVRYQNLGGIGISTAALPVTQAGKITGDATLITFYEGVRDELAVGAGGTRALNNWKEDYLYAIAVAKSKAPGARIVLATIPNVVSLPFYELGRPHALSFFERERNGRAAVLMNNFIRSLPYAIVDLACDPVQYDPRFRVPNDDVHPNDAGHAEIARHFYAVIATANPPKPQSHCHPYEDLPKNELEWTHPWQR